MCTKKTDTNNSSSTNNAYVHSVLAVRDLLIDEAHGTLHSHIVYSQFVHRAHVTYEQIGMLWATLKIN